jgi:hypothetical protein
MAAPEFSHADAFGTCSAVMPFRRQGGIFHFLFPRSGYHVEFDVRVGSQRLHLPVLRFVQGDDILHVLTPGKLVVGGESEVLQAFTSLPIAHRVHEMPGLSVRERNVFAAKSSPITRTSLSTTRQQGFFITECDTVFSYPRLCCLYEVVHVVPCVVPVLVCCGDDKVICPHLCSHPFITRAIHYQHAYHVVCFPVL